MGEMVVNRSFANDGIKDIPGASYGCGRRRLPLAGTLSNSSDGYKLQFVNDAEKGDFFDLKLLLTEDFQFSSEPEFGLEAVDIVTNTIRRSLSGHFNRAGWLAIPQLMIHRASHCIKLISLSREDQSSRPVPYANVMNDFRHGGRAMFPQGYFDE